MRTNFKKAMMPLAVVVLGAAAAFATNAKKESEKVNATMTAYYYDHNATGNKCQPITVDCVDFVTEDICTDLSGTIYWKIDQEIGLSCSELLYRIN